MKRADEGTVQPVIGAELCFLVVRYSVGVGGCGVVRYGPMGLHFSSLLFFSLDQSQHHESHVTQTATRLLTPC